MISEDVKLGNNVKIPYPDLVNLYGCELSDEVFIGPFTEIQKGAKIGARTRISSHSFICEGVSIGEDCFIGHGVIFINDKFTEEKGNWALKKTDIGNNIRIGSNATILPVKIKDNSVIGAGSVVTKDVSENTTVIGNPAREINKNRNLIMEKKQVLVPFLDLKKQYQTIKDEVKSEIDWTLNNTSFILGEKVKNFEENFARYCGKKNAIAVNSGTSALHLALLANNIGEGDEVITVPNTFIATVEAISYVKAKPVFVDIDPSNHTIDVSKIEEKITSKTRAIIPVHLYGHPCDMDPIIEISKKYGLVIIEDCCQAHGAEYKGKKVPVSDFGCFSFYPGKNLGAYGEGGAIVTNDDEKSKLVRMLRDHGQEKKYFHRYVGYNYRMDGFQGAVLDVKLKYLDEWIDKRREKAELYDRLLEGIVELPREENYAKSVYHLYVIRVKERDELIAYLKQKGVGTGLHYPIPIHLQESYKHLSLSEGSFPTTEKYSKEILSLPLFPEINNEQIEYVANVIKEFYERNRQKTMSF
jgi:dTDP-4-amino-4,6-dideoxygalactose transaminase/acetyltransferase-like isoleucine patch superfamily enzyme